MYDLNLPPASLKIKEQEGKKYVYDPLRRQYVRLTPEEYVRQRFVAFLVGSKSYPESRLVNEAGIEVGGVKKRCDTILYDHFLQPLMILEYKAPTVAVTQRTFNQIARYNMALKVPWLVVSNGLSHFCCRIDRESGEVLFMKEIPDYGELSVGRDG